MSVWVETLSDDQLLTRMWAASLRAAASVCVAVLMMLTVTSDVCSAKGPLNCVINDTSSLLSTCAPEMTSLRLFQTGPLQSAPYASFPSLMTM